MCMHVYTVWLASWSVRHGAILGLSRVNVMCRSLPMKDGLSDVAWCRLVDRHRAEKDPRVLQAFNIAQVKVIMVCLL